MIFKAIIVVLDHANTVLTQLVDSQADGKDEKLIISLISTKLKYSAIAAMLPTLNTTLILLLDGYPSVLQSLSKEYISCLNAALLTCQSLITRLFENLPSEGLENEGPHNTYACEVSDDQVFYLYQNVA